MTTAYVYAPFSGSAVSLNCYCNRAWTPDLSICSGSCANNDCRCNGTVAVVAKTAHPVVIVLVGTVVGT